MQCSVQYRILFALLSAYWKTYGKSKALMQSPYTHTSVVITILCFGSWQKANWWDDPLDVLPNIVGFTIAGYAILLSIGNDKFRSILASAGTESNSGYLILNAAIVHFAIVQLIAIIFALVSKALFSIGLVTMDGQYLGVIDPWMAVHRVFSFSLWALGYFIFIYALLCGFGVVVSIFMVSKLFRTFSIEEIKEPRIDE